MNKEDMPEITWGDSEPNTHAIYFDDTTPTNVTAVVGQKAILPCRVVNIGRKDVSVNKLPKSFFVLRVAITRSLHRYRLKAELLLISQNKMDKTLT